MKDINELWEYLSYEKTEYLFIIGVLDTIGHDGTEQPTKIIYDYGNGETKVLNEDSVIGLLELFHTDFSK